MVTNRNTTSEKNQEYTIQYQTNFTNLNVLEQDDVPIVEQTLIKEFVNANIFAMTMALRSLQEIMNNNETTTRTTTTISVDGDQYCASSSTSTSIATNTYETTSVDGVSHYDPLELEPDVMERSRYTCDTTDAFDFVGYTENESLETPYQDMSFMYNNKTDDICVDLGTYCVSR